MAITPKNWQNWPSSSTPETAAALKALEGRTGNYAGATRLVGPGVAGYEDFRVKQRSFGAAAFADVGLGSTLQACYVAADGAAGIQCYEYSGAQLVATAGSADPTNPRIDCVVAEAPTSPDDLGPRITWVQGVATAGATLLNRNGAPAISATRILLADVLRPAGVDNVTTANIQDRRLRSTLALPFTNLGTGRDEVPFDPGISQLTLTGGGAALSVGVNDNRIGVCLMALRRRIVGATRLRWKYRQGGTAVATNYTFYIFDASGRVIATTTTAAFTGALNTYQVRAETFASAPANGIFEEGLYFVAFAPATMTAASSATYLAAVIATSNGSPGGAQNTAFVIAGVAAPVNLTGFTDLGLATADTAAPPVPLVTLAVG